VVNLCVDRCFEVTLGAQRLDEDVSGFAESQAHFFTFDSEQTGFTGAEHAEFASATDPEFFESMHVLLVTAHFNDDCIGIGSEKLDRHWIGVSHRKDPGEVLGW